MKAGILFILLMGVVSWVFALEWEELREVAKNATVNNLDPLLDAVERFNIAKGRKDTALQWAAMVSSPKVVKALWLAGVNIHARTDEQSTALHFAAASNKNPKMIKLLLVAGADIDVRAEDGYTPLHSAVLATISKSPGVVKVLLAAGADVHAKTNQQNTPLHLAALGRYQNLEIIKALLVAGADIHAVNKAGQTPWQGFKNSIKARLQGKVAQADRLRILDEYQQIRHDLSRIKRTLLIAR